MSTNDTTPAQGSASAVLAPVSPVRELLSVALPAVITMTSYTVMQFIDTLIVKELDPGAISAVGNAGVFAFIPGAALMGLLSVVNTFVAQNLGAGTVRNGAAYVWNGLYLNLALWAVIFVPMAFFIEDIFRITYGIFGQDIATGQLLERQVTYGSILLLGMIFNLSARTVGHFFYGVHRPAVVMVSAICGNVVNLILCSLWVLGGLGVPGSETLWWDLGFESMDVKGAALSTVVGGMVEFSIPMLLFLAPWINRAYSTRAGWRFSWHHIKGLLRLGWPAGLMQGNELFGWYIFMAILVGAFNLPEGAAPAPGSDWLPDGTPVHTEAGWIVLRYMHLSFMPAVGLSIALTSIVGKYVGARDEKTAIKRIWLGLGLTVAYMSICALAFVLFRDPLIRVFIDSDAPPGTADEIARIGTTILIVAAAFQFFDAIAISLAGALRGAGDTVWPGVVTVILTWTVLVGGGWLVVVNMPQWESLGPWLGAAGYIVFLSIALFWRFLTGGWKGKAVAGDDEVAQGASPETCLVPALADSPAPDATPQSVPTPGAAPAPAPGLDEGRSDAPQDRA